MLPEPEAVPFCFYFFCLGSNQDRPDAWPAARSCLMQRGFNPRRWRSVSGWLTTGAGAPGGACRLQISGRKPAEQKSSAGSLRRCSTQHRVCSGRDKLIPAGAGPSLFPAPRAAGSACIVLFWLLPGLFDPFASREKTRMQSLQPDPKAQYRSVYEALKKIVLTEGFWRPLRGINVTMLGAGPAHAMYFACYEKIKKSLSDTIQHGGNSHLANGI
nr:mitoferrin-1 isoform X1 [Anser cygnoides]